MSHVATVAVEIKDLDALRVACAKVGLEFHEGQRTFRWFGKWMNDYAATDAAYKAGIDPKAYGTCEHAIGVKGSSSAYEVGVMRTTSGKLALAWDFWGSQGRALEAVAGAKCGNLVREYVSEVARKTLMRAGYMATGTKKLADGTVELVFTHA